MSARVAPRPRPFVRGAAVAMAAALLLAGCAEDSSSTPDEDSSNETISITITDDEITPLGERFEVEAGEPFLVEVTADRDDALHLHADPEQTWEFTEGTTEVEARIDQPGVYEVELHDPDVVVLQLEVR